MTTTTRDLADGETTLVTGSGAKPYLLKNRGGVYSCSCPAWMNQSTPATRRTCKHLRALRGSDVEDRRLADAATAAGLTPTQPGAAARPTPVARSRAAADGKGPPLLLAEKWEVHIDVTGYWLSEKLDGVRAYWDGTQFLSRLGNRFHAPDWFTKGLPDTPLDGELWGGRKLFQRTVGIVKSQNSPEWKSLSYVVFDAPSHPGPFESRIERCVELLGNGACAFAKVLPQETCRGVDHLRSELARIDGLGGEGIMARKPKTAYEIGRSATLLKVKTFRDAEARVVAHLPGVGRHKGRLGALLVELADGTQFNVGTGFSDKERENPPAVGALVSFRYQELSDRGVPRFPSYLGERIDLAQASMLNGGPSLGGTSTKR